MKLFEIDENFNVKPNKVWIGMIPEFKILLTRDKSNNGTGGGKTEEGRHVKARREFAFIYFAVDFSSPIRDWEPEEREKEALKYANLKPEDIDEKVVIAAKKYEELQIKAARSLRSLRSMKKGLDALDKYLETVDFSVVDKKGEQLHDPAKFTKNITMMNEIYDEMSKFEKRVEDELYHNDSGIRGNATLGDKEAGRSNTVTTVWSESDIEERSKQMQEGKEVSGPKSTVSFNDLARVIAQPKQLLTEDEINNTLIMGDE